MRGCFVWCCGNAQWPVCNLQRIFSRATEARAVFGAWFRAEVVTAAPARKFMRSIRVILSYLELLLTVADVREGVCTQSIETVKFHCRPFAWFACESSTGASAAGLIFTISTARLILRWRWSTQQQTVLYRGSLQCHDRCGTAVAQERDALQQVLLNQIL